jgi:hypothetical protein
LQPAQNIGRPPSTFFRDPETSTALLAAQVTRPRPNRRETTNRTRNTKKRILAIPAAVPAMPPNPSTAAMSAITRNVIAQLSIDILSV